MHISVPKKKSDKIGTWEIVVIAPEWRPSWIFLKISYFYEKYAELSIISGKETKNQEYKKKETITNFFLIIFN